VKTKKLTMPAFAVISLFLMLAVYCGDGNPVRSERKIVYGALTDPRDGQNYRTIEIGGLTWMADNLNYASDGSRCYGDDASNCAVYGRLYDWGAATEACPDGWRLPDNDDWYNLLTSAGGEQHVVNIDDYYWYFWYVPDEGLKSKTGWDDWVCEEWMVDGEYYCPIGQVYSGNGTDKFGFSALPGGCLFEEYNDDSIYVGFYGIGEWGLWWSATESGGADTAYNRFMSSMGTGVGEDENASKSDMLSVRCVLGG